MNFKKLIIVLAIPVAFFLISLFTLSDYGINWDEPIHFIRGQAYFTYFLTGKTNYQKVSSRPSYFQNTSLDGAYYLKNDSGHPPLNGILAAASNWVFYQKLNLLGDIDAYHLFNILTGTLTVFVVVIFACQVYGPFPAIISGLALSTYPLFFSETHFNIKDPPETAFFALCIWLFWLSLKKFNWRILTLSIVAFAISLSMKFNAVFLPLVLIPYLLVRYCKSYKRVILKIPKKYLTVLFLSPIIVAGIFIGSWPFLWHDTINNFLKIVTYYKNIGSGGEVLPGYSLPGGVNLYPITWIFVTTPPILILLTFIGILSSIRDRKDKEKSSLLWLIWFLVPILRVSVPGSAIYGGVRQIFEYIPGLALLSGAGAHFLVERFQFRKNFLVIIALLLFVPQVIVLSRLHPNENVYFNSFIGGLSGAKEKNIPYWGNSYGNAYWQAVKWVNSNAEMGAKLGLVQGTGLNIPAIQLRPDIQFSNGNWTGIFRGGEYLVELTFNSRINPYPYAWEYVDKILDPVYEVKVDGVSIANVWKNDLAHTKTEYRKSEEKIWRYNYSIADNEIDIRFPNSIVLTRFFLHYNPDKKCAGVNATIETSLDNINWKTELESIPNEQVYPGKLPNNISPFFLAGRTARQLKITPVDKSSCLLKGSSIEIWGLNQ